jgi:haloalkane dehalogenase
MADSAEAIEFTPSRELYPFESRRFDSTVGKVHYVDEGTGPPILFLHGNPTWSFLYRNIIIRLRGRFRCVAVDYPGFGLSARPPGYGYTPGEHARVISELVEHLDLKDVIIMGQDWGGPIGIAIALAAPARVKGFVFGNTWCWPTTRLVNRLFSGIMRTPPLRWAMLKRNLFVQRMMPPAIARKLTEEEMNHYRAVQPTPEARIGVAEFPRQLTVAGPWLADLAQAVPEALGNKPLLLVWGMKDFAFRPGAFISRWQEMFPDNVLVELPAAKHFIQEDAPEEIAAAILERFGTA